MELLLYPTLALNYSQIRSDLESVFADGKEHEITLERKSVFYNEIDFGEVSSIVTDDLEVAVDFVLNSDWRGTHSFKAVAREDVDRYIYRLRLSDQTSDVEWSSSSFVRFLKNHSSDHQKLESIAKRQLFSTHDIGILDEGVFHRILSNVDESILNPDFVRDLKEFVTHYVHYFTPRHQPHGGGLSPRILFERFCNDYDHQELKVLCQSSEGSNQIQDKFLYHTWELVTSSLSKPSQSDVQSVFRRDCREFVQSLIRPSIVNDLLTSQRITPIEMIIDIDTHRILNSSLTVTTGPYGLSADSNGNLLINCHLDSNVSSCIGMLDSLNALTVLIDGEKRETSEFGSHDQFVEVNAKMMELIPISMRHVIQNICDLESIDEAVNVGLSHSINQCERKNDASVDIDVVIPAHHFMSVVTID